MEMGTSLSSYALQGKPDSFLLLVLNVLIPFKYDLLMYKFILGHVYITFKYCIYAYIVYTCNIKQGQSYNIITSMKEKDHRSLKISIRF